MSGLSRIAAWKGRTSEAIALQQEALEGFRALHADDFVADSLVRMVEIHVVAGDVTTALSTAAEAEAAVARLGEVAILPSTLSRLHGRGLLLAGRGEEARAKFEAAFDLATADGFVYEAALASMGLGRIDRDENRVSDALEQLAALGVLAPPPGS